MTGDLVLAVLIAVLAGYVAARARRFVAAQWFLVQAWRWFSGEAHHGRPVTDAGWLRAGQRALTATGHATRWWHLPRWKRAVWRTSGTFAAVTVIYGLLANPLLTISLLAGAAWALLLAGCWLLWQRARSRREQRTWLHPLHLAAHELAGIPRAARAASWITAELGDDGAVRKAALALPAGWPADAKDEGRLVAIASKKLGIEAAEASWRRAGQTPQLVLTQSEPPPSRVGWDDVSGAVEKAGPDEIVCGIGKKGAIVKASLATDSPHFAINMGTGGGKSSLAAFWLMQELRRGAVAMVLDNKLISHPWLYKDESGEYSYLPNVAYLSSIEEIHDGMVWLGGELGRRNQVARRAVDASGRLHGTVGPRLIILAEELNFAMPQLREYWAEIRSKDEPKKSPALTAFGGVAFAGRAVKMHLLLIGQMLTAEVTGSRDSSVKENVGVTAMARYGQAGWNTAVGKNVPMPPSPSVLGRVQVVTAGGVRETQTPKPDLLLYRRMVLEGDVTPCPAGMPGAPRVPMSQPVATLATEHPEQPVVVEDTPRLGPPGGLVTLKEAVGGKVVSCTLPALRKASQRDPAFPQRKATRGLAAEYDPVELAEWQRGRERP